MKLLKALGKAWMVFCTVVLTAYVLMMAGNFILNWSKTRPLSLDIDKCLDSGGSWNAEQEICVQAS